MSCNPLVHLNADLLQEPPNMDKVECKGCNEMGHYARECPNKRCRNCEKAGHGARECPVHSPISLQPVNPSDGLGTA